MKAKKKFNQIIATVIATVICIGMMPMQKVNAAGVSVANNGNSSIVVSVDKGSHTGYVIHFVQEEDYDLYVIAFEGYDCSGFPSGDFYEDGAPYTAFIRTENSVTGSQYDNGPSFQTGDLVYVMVEFFDYYGGNYYIKDWCSESIIVGDASQVAVSSHTHSYEWIIITEAGIGQDGAEQYVCSCGDIKMTQTIPAASAYVNGLYGAIKMRIKTAQLIITPVTGQASVSM